MRRRTRAREAAIQFLYQVDLRGDSVLQDLPAFLEDLFLEEAASRAKARSRDRSVSGDEATPDAEMQAFAARLIEGTRRATPEIDRLLQQVARNWDLRRMAAVDRNVLRMAVFELLHCPDIPPKVTINEAIELGKKFSTANSGGFINGILDRIRIDHGPGLVDAGETAGQGEAVPES